MRCFVVGGTGVLGRRVVPLLVAAGHDVAASSRDACRDKRVLASGAAPVRADLFAPETLAYGEAGGVGVVLRLAQLYAPDSSHTRAQAHTGRLGIDPFAGSPDSRLAVVGVDAAARAVVAALTLPSGVYNEVDDDDPPTRRRMAMDVARVVGRRRLRPIPTALLRRANPDSDVLLRSQRVSNAKLSDAAGWRPDHAGTAGLDRTIGEILR